MKKIILLLCLGITFFGPTFICAKGGSEDSSLLSSSSHQTVDTECCDDCEIECSEGCKKTLVCSVLCDSCLIVGIGVVTYLLVRANYQGDPYFSPHNL